MFGFLKRARENSNKFPFYIQGDMRELPFGDKSFSTVLFLFTSFGLLSEEENLSVIKEVIRVLKPKGVFCLDILNRDSFIKYYLPCMVVEREDNFMIDFPSFEPKSGFVKTRRIMIKGEERKETTFYLRLYNLTEVNSLLKSSGMEIKEVYGNWDGEIFSPFSRRMIIFAQKN